MASGNQRLPLGFKKGKATSRTASSPTAAMGKKQQPSPPSETFVAADQLPAAEILAGELVSVVARNVESGRLSEHAISQAWATALARLGLAAAADGASGGSTTLVPGSSSRQVASAQEIFDALVEIIGGDKPLPAGLCALGGAAGEQVGSGGSSSSGGSGGDGGRGAGQVVGA